MQNDPGSNRAKRQRGKEAKRGLRTKAILANHGSITEAITRTTDTLFDLLKTDLDLGLTFTDIARRVTDPERRSRLVRNAFTAYETVRRKKAEIRWNLDQKRELDVKLEQLKAMLVALGKSHPTTDS